MGQGVDLATILVVVAMMMVLLLMVLLLLVHPVRARKYIPRVQHIPPLPFPLAGYLSPVSISYEDFAGMDPRVNLATTTT